MPISSLETHVGFWLRFVSNRVSKRFAQLLEERSVSVSEWVSLRHLYDATDTTPLDVMGALGMTKGAVSKILVRLESRALVWRVTDPGDCRAHRIGLTRAGRALVPALTRLADANDLHFFGILSSAQRHALVDIMATVVRAHGLTQVPTE